MAPGLHDIKIKNSNIKKIFETMDYGSARDSHDLAQAWLRDNEHDAESTAVGDFNAVVLEKEWSKKAPLERCFAMERFVKEIEKHSTLICQMESLTRGILLNDTKTKGLPSLIDYLQFYLNWPIKTKKENLQQEGSALCIIGDDCFLGFLGSVLGPALVAGFNIIFHTELKIGSTVSLLIKLAENCGISKGTLIRVSGDKNLQAIVNSNKINVLSVFSNSYSKECFPVLRMPKVVRVTKGKSPMIVFNNADLDSASDSVIDAAWGYGGQLPWCLSTVLVQEDIFEVFVDKLKVRLSSVHIDGTDQRVDVSSLASNASQKLQKTLLLAKSYGIETFQKYPSSEDYQPTLLIGGKVTVNNVILEDNDSMAVSVLPFRTTNEAVSLANNSRNSIGASVWTENIGLANEVVGKLNFPNIWINSFGNFSASVSFTPWKDSGLGFIGGEEGLCHYKDFIPHQKINKKSHTEFIGEGGQSFYGGSFRKSESDGNFEVPNAKDVVNAIAAARKGFELWKKQTPSNRNLLLRQIALEIYKKKASINESAGTKDETINTWIELTYEAFSELFKAGTGNVSQCKGMFVRSIKEPLGVVGIDESTEMGDTFLCIMSALLLGNSVIVFNYNKAFAKFYLEVCKILCLLNFPAGVFNVILNCNQDVKNCRHKELDAHFVLSYDSANTFNELPILKRSYVPMNEWNQAVYLCKIKNVWCNIGDSVM